MIPFLVIHFFIFFFLINITLAVQEPKCEAFDCRVPGKVYHPYSKNTQPECGILPIDCTKETPTLVDLKGGGKSYQVKNLTDDGTLVIHDPVLQQLLNSKNCSANSSISFGSLPKSPFFSLEFIARNTSLTFLKCSKRLKFIDDSVPGSIKQYGDCGGNQFLYYSYPKPMNLSEFDENKNPFSSCSYALLPLVDDPSSAAKDNYPFSLCSAEHHLKWELSHECQECSRNGNHCLTNDDISDAFKCVNVIEATPKSDRSKKIKIGVGAGVGASLFTIILAVAAICLLRRWRRKNELHKNSALISRSISPDLSMQADPEKGSSYFNTPIFTYKELEEATNNFDSSRELGDGGFGTVYYGVLKDGRAVAVKRLYENNGKRVEQFMNEVGILSLLRHTNLVSLYGCTSRHSRELLLVYEYVSNGTVADHLHGEHSSARLVTWPIRLSIAIESAGALVYLHASDIVHRDVKTNNILLDKNFHVKVADFGLSRLFPTAVTHVSTAPQGTPGYVDPEYHQCYQLTSKSDVYSFGVVLIELISSKPAVDINRHRHEINLSNMAVNKIHNDALHELVDISLGYDTNATIRRTMTLVAELAFRCLQQDSDARPTMVEVLEVLKEIEVERTKVVKPGEMDIPAKDVRLLNNNPPVSPNSVTDKWVSISSTPNASS